MFHTQFSSNRPTYIGQSFCYASSVDNILCSGIYACSLGLQDAFYERSYTVFWTRISTKNDDINVAMQSPQRSLVPMTKLLKGFEVYPRSIKTDIFHGSISEYVTNATGLSTDTEFISRHSKKILQGQEKLMEKHSFE